MKFALAGRFEFTRIEALFLSPVSMFIVQSAVKDLLKKLGMMTAGDFPEAVSKWVEEGVKKAGARAKENGRVTVRPCDL